jgi:outer membrane protein OmpA-like peptidoglycan-associated protein
MFGKLKLLAACSIVAASLALPVSAVAEPVTTDGLIKALTPKGPAVVKRPATRSLSVTSEPVAAAPDESKGFVDSLRNRSARSLTLAERDKIVEIAAERAKTDIEIRFDFNSDKIAKSAIPSVDALGRALTSDGLKGSSFVLAGHTDTVGSDEFNQELSERRADAVKRYLVDKFKMSPDTLVTAGYGESRLKDTKNPAGAANRRVEIVNLEK